MGGIGRFLGRIGGAILKIPGKLLAKAIGIFLPDRAKELIARWGPLASTVILIAAGAGVLNFPGIDVLIQILGAPLAHPDQLAEVGAVIAAIIGAAFGVGQKAENVVAEAEGKRDRIATLSEDTERILEREEPRMLWLQRRARYLVHHRQRPHQEATLQAMRELHQLGDAERLMLPVSRAREAA